MIEPEFITYLLTQTAITDLVGQNIFPQKIPQKSDLPCITTTVISDIPNQSLNPLPNAVSATARIQCDSWSVSNSQCNAITDALFTALHGLGHVTMGSTTVGEVGLDSRSSAYQSQPSKGTDYGTWRTISDFVILYTVV